MVLSLEEIAENIRNHALAGSLDVDLLNNLLRPCAQLVLTQDTSNLTFLDDSRNAIPPITMAMNVDPSMDTIRREAAVSLAAAPLSRILRPRSSKSRNLQCNKRAELLQSAELKSSSTSRSSAIKDGRNTTISYSSRKQSSGVPAEQDGLGEASCSTNVPSTKKPSMDTTIAAYPVNLASHTINKETALESSRIHDDASINVPSMGTKRQADADDNSMSSKARRTAHTVMRRHNDKNISAHPQTEKPTSATARQAFAARWAVAIPDFCDWQQFDKFAHFGNTFDQAPYSAIEPVMARACAMGTPNVLAAFGRSVQTWVSAQNPANKNMVIPDHLKELEGLDATHFQRFWKASQVAHSARGVEGMAILLRRKALIDLVASYDEVVLHIRRAAATRLIRLKPGQMALSVAKLKLYEILYPNIEHRKRQRILFNYELKCANPYVRLRKHYNSDGILAMIPSRINEGELHSTDDKFKAFLEILDVTRPHLHGPRLVFFSRLINIIAGGEIPDKSMLVELAGWIS